MIVVADNQPLTRDALLGYLAGRRVGVAADKAALTVLLTAEPAAVVVLDFSLFDFATPESLLIHLRRFPSVHWLLLSADFAPDLLRLFGGEPQVSFLIKDATRAEVERALALAARGERTVCAAVADRLRAAPMPVRVSGLTPTETEILTLLARGLSVKEMAALRHVSPHTVVTHKKNLFRKLGVSTAYEAARYALRAGLADPVEYYI